MMKNFAYILALWVLFLSIRPCMDKPMGNLLQNSEVSQTTNHGSHQDTPDSCSPFCTCQCCQTASHVSEGNVSSPAFELVFNFNPYSSNFQSLDPSELLIPPKA